MTDPATPATGTRALGVGVVAALLAGGLALSFGTGYVADRAVFSGSSAWLRQDDDAALVAGAGGEAQAFEGGIAEGEIVQGEDGTFHVVTEGDEGRTFTGYDGEGDGEAPAPSIEASAEAEVLSGPRGAWLVEPGEGTVQPIDPATLAPEGDLVAVGAPLVGQAVDVEGTLWLLDDGGRAHSVRGAALAAPVAVPVADPEQASLVTVADQAAVADPVSGTLTLVGGRSWSLAGLEGGRVEAASTQPGPLLALAVLNGSRRSLVVVDVASGDELPERSLGDAPISAPLPVGDTVYVPTVVDGEPELRAFQAPTLDEVGPVAVPAGDGDFEGAEDGRLGYDAFLEGTRLWANDPRSADALTVGEGEDPRQVHKLDPDDEGGDDRASGDEADAADPGDEPPIPEPEAGAGDAETAEPPIPSPGSSATPAPPTTPVGPGPAADPAPVGPTGPATPSAPPDTPAEPIDVRVPDLVAMAPDEACAAITRLDLLCAPEPTEDDEEEVDVVVAQSPRPDATAQQGDTVTIEFFVRGRTDVPDLEGLSVEDATTALTAAGLAGAPEARDDAEQTVPLNTVQADQEPAAGEEVDRASAVTYTYFTRHAPIPFDPAPAMGLPQADACAQAIAPQGFPVCTAAAGNDLPPTRAQEGTVYAADPAAAGEVSPDDTITLFFYGPYQPKTAVAPVFGSCDEAAAWAANGGWEPFASCATPPASVGGPTPPGARVAQDPVEGTTITEGQALNVFTYQPGMVTLTIWVRTSPTTGKPNAHYLGVGPPPDGGAWSAAAPVVAYTGPEPGTAPLYCWSFTTSNGTIRHYCGFSPPSGGPWGGQTGPIAHAYPDNPGFGAARWSCNLYRNGANFIFSYWSSGPSCVQADPREDPTQAPDVYLVGEDLYTPG